jgi:hypothetical protein
MDLVDQGKDAVNRSMREDAVAKIEDMYRSTISLRENMTNPAPDLGLGGKEDRGVEVPRVVSVLEPG